MNLKYYIITLVFIWLLLPFILLSNFYPFFRYGMFAETSATHQGEVQYVLFYQDKANKLHPFDPKLIGVSTTGFTYLTRRYVAQGDTVQFFRQICSPRAQKLSAKHWELWQINYHTKNATDSVKIYTWNEPKK